MKKLVLIFLVAIGVNTAKAQCPINDILATKDPLAIAGLIVANTDCIKQTLTQSPEYTNTRVYIDYVYNTSAPWIYHTNLPKEKLFEEFYQKWSSSYPSVSAKLPDSKEFYDAVAAMVGTDRNYFAQKKATRVPLKYQQWLYVKGLKEKYGERNINILANAASKIANLPATNNYAALVSSY
ncbi:hypothetical protein [Mucilaginibacter antarcticus]|uniref:DUF4932 domain-containing protein n=1 Tax=Mucilaginibacter antarcticus TaxID=1855725 RepID=A0ABW5XPM0_9SPHI